MSEVSIGPRGTSLMRGNVVCLVPGGLDQSPLVTMVGFKADLSFPPTHSAIIDHRGSSFDRRSLTFGAIMHASREAMIAIGGM